MVCPERAEEPIAIELPATPLSEVGKLMAFVAAIWRPVFAVVILTAPVPLGVSASEMLVSEPAAAKIGAAVVAAGVTER